MDYFVIFSDQCNFLPGKYHYKRARKGRGMRKLCRTCGQRPVAINYRKNGVVYYRSKCDHCARGLDDGVARWARAGYKLKSKCDKCAYASKYPEQFNVYHVDGNLDNCRPTNLKTVCANCQRLLHVLGLPWRQGDLTPDF
jgi:hypothetical protein